MSTHIKLPLDRWLPKEGRTSGETTAERDINARLEEMRAMVKMRYHEMFIRGEVITAAKLKNARTTATDVGCYTIIEQCERFISKYRPLVGKTIGRATLSRYTAFEDRLTQFLKVKHRKSDWPLNRMEYLTLSAHKVGTVC